MNNDDYFGGKVDKVIGLIGEEELESAAAEIVAPQMDLLELTERPFEIESFALFAQKTGVPEADGTARDFKSALDHRHQRHQFAFFAGRHFFLAFAQFFFPDRRILALKSTLLSKF